MFTSSTLNYLQTTIMDKISTENKARIDQSVVWISGPESIDPDTTKAPGPT